MFKNFTKNIFYKIFHKKSTKEHQILFSSKQPPLYLIIFSINLGNLITKLFFILPKNVFLFLK